MRVCIFVSGQTIAVSTKPARVPLSTAKTYSLLAAETVIVNSFAV